MPVFLSAKRTLKKGLLQDQNRKIRVPLGQRPLVIFSSYVSLLSRLFCGGLRVVRVMAGSRLTLIGCSARIFLCVKASGYLQLVIVSANLLVRGGDIPQQNSAS